jgi:hypothetical protein
MGIPSGAFIPPSPVRAGETVNVPTTMSAHLCGIGCEVASASPIGLTLVAAIAIAIAIAVQRWRPGRPGSG